MALTGAKAVFVLASKAAEVVPGADAFNVRQQTAPTCGSNLSDCWGPAPFGKNKSGLREHGGVL